MIQTTITQEVQQEKEIQQIDEKRIGFFQAWLLPKVLFYASAYFCAKFALQVYFLSLFEWLDTFAFLDSNQDANISTMNDAGALIGSSAMGYISDMTYGKRSPVTLTALVFSCLIFYSLTIRYDSISYSKLMASFFFYGMFMQGVTNTIAATCSADIGKGSSANGGSERAVATVTGIIDGSGSVGASIGQFTVGATQSAFGWRYGYLLLIAIAQTVTIIPLAKITCGEV